jgi:hypothetical protein
MARSPSGPWAGFALLLTATLALIGPPAAAAQPAAQDKLDRVPQARSRQLTGRSRVIVEFRSGADPRVVTGSGGHAGRLLPSVAALVADVDNTTIAGLAGNPRVARIRADHPVVPMLERTGATIAAAGANDVQADRLHQRRDRRDRLRDRDQGRL